jgi:hypothetical protein
MLTKWLSEAEHPLLSDNNNLLAFKNYTSKELKILIGDCYGTLVNQLVKGGHTRQNHRTAITN